MAKEAGHFDFETVASVIAAKMIRRHPHVFDDARVENAAAQSHAWEETKAHERRQKAGGRADAPSLLDDVPVALPALTRAAKLQRRAARVGFDWPDLAPVLDKIDEELAELRLELDAERSADRIGDEVGDLLFAIVNLARHLNIDPEQALRGTNRKFERRFGSIERSLAERGRAIETTALEELEALWQAAKAQE